MTNGNRKLNFAESQRMITMTQKLIDHYGSKSAVARETGYTYITILNWSRGGGDKLSYASCEAKLKEIKQ